jgi:hypothetical protein
MATSKIKNNKIKRSEIGSKVTIHRRLKIDRINNAPTSLDLTPTSPQMLRVNTGGAILSLR